jgi:hypothetical protein
MQANNNPGALSDAELREKAQKRAKDMVGFYIHFTCYAAVNVFLFVLWAFPNPSGLVFPWPIFTTIGWGIGIIFHFFAVFGSGRMQEKLAEEEYQRMKRMQGGSQ